MILSLTNFPAFTPNGVYWQPSTDLKNEGYFVNDPDVPNDRESLFLDYNNDFAVAVSIAAGDQMSPGVDFINIFNGSFYARSSHSERTQSSCQYLLTLLGSARIKAVCRTLMKLSSGLNFINVLSTAFAQADPKA